jgi:hypothetical protein
LQAAATGWIFPLHWSYATTTSMFRLWRLVPDEVIPGTLNVGHTLPTVVQALIYITIVEVEFETLLLMIMMGSCAFLMPVASMQFIRKRKYDLRAALGLAIGGMPAVVLAAALVWSLPLNYIRWLVVIVVIYAAASLLRASVVESRAQYAA